MLLWKGNHNHFMHMEQLHMHKRKKLSTGWKVRFVDRLVLVVAVAYPLSTIPQILDIWIGRSVQGVSLITWSLFLVLQSILLAYGVVHKDRKLTLMWALWVFMYILVVVGLVIYG